MECQTRKFAQEKRVTFKVTGETRTFQIIMSDSKEIKKVKEKYYQCGNLKSINI